MCVGPPVGQWGQERALRTRSKRRAALPSGPFPSSSVVLFSSQALESSADRPQRKRGGGERERAFLSVTKSSASSHRWWWWTDKSQQFKVSSSSSSSLPRFFFIIVIIVISLRGFVFLREPKLWNPLSIFYFFLVFKRIWMALRFISEWSVHLLDRICWSSHACSPLLASTII